MPLKNPSKDVKRKWNLSTRYGISPDAWAALMQSQQGLCAICQTPPTRPVVDHDHATGKVRGILCHGCNIKLPAVDDTEFLASALRYLGRSA